MAAPMQSIRDFLPAGFWKSMERELGREEALRLLWPAIVGKRLAGNSQLQCLRASHLVVSVPDRVWKGSLESLEEMILSVVNRFWGEPVVRSIEFVTGSRSIAWMQDSAARASPKTTELPPVDLPVGGIGDEPLRAAFLRSAQKYFAWQQERSK